MKDYQCSAICFSVVASGWLGFGGAQGAVGSCLFVFMAALSMITKK